MKQALKNKLKIIIVFGVLFLVVIALLLLIFLAGKKLIRLLSTLTVERL